MILDDPDPGSWKQQSQNVIDCCFSQAIAFEKNS